MKNKRKEKRFMVNLDQYGPNPFLSLRKQYAATTAAIPAVPVIPEPVTYTAVIDRPQPVIQRIVGGKPYPKLGTGVSKWRRYCFAEMTQGERRQYGEAVCAAIGSLQRSELMSCLTPTPKFYSYPNDTIAGEAILARIGAANTARLQNRKYNTWGVKPGKGGGEIAAYADAMKAKRKPATGE